MPTQKLYGKRSQAKSRPHKGRKKPPQKQSQGKWLLIWLGLTAVAMLSATAGAILAVSLNSKPLLKAKLTPEEAAVFEQETAISQDNLSFPKLTRPVNILVLGTKILTSDLKQPPEIDLGYHALVDGYFEGLTDAMLLIRFNPENSKMSVLSVPRDTRARVDGYGRMKLNAANYYGGPALTAKSISNLLEGVAIDRYVRVNVQGMAQLIDALGGVDVYVPKDMKYTDESQHLYINLKEGQQRLDGEKAMHFMRFRYDTYGDIGRVQRQQILMRALVEQALKPTTVMRMPKVMDVIQSNIDTNLTIEEIVALAGFATQTNRSQVQMLMLPGRFSGDGKEDVSYWLPNRQGIEEMVAQHFDQGYSTLTSTTPAYLRIAIQNSTGERQAANALINALDSEGYRNVNISRRWREPLEVTQIVAQSGDEASAAALKVALGFGEVIVESTGSLTSDVTIRLGADWQGKLSSFSQDGDLELDVDGGELGESEEFDERE